MFCLFFFHARFFVQDIVVSVRGHIYVPVSLHQGPELLRCMLQVSRGGAGRGTGVDGIAWHYRRFENIPRLLT